MRNTHKPIHPAGQSRFTTEEIRTGMIAPEESSPELLDALHRKPFAIFHPLVADRAVDVLQQYLNQSYISEETCSRFLLEEDPSDIRVRLIFMQALAQKQGSIRSHAEDPSNDEPLFSASTPASVAEPAAIHRIGPSSPEEKLRHWSRRLSIREPSLRLPLQAMKLRCLDTIDGFGTDGTAFFWNPVLSPEDAHPTLIDFQHMVIHCLFGHVRIPTNADPVYWSTACDLAAEYLQQQIFPDSVADEKTRRKQTRNSFIYSEFPNSLYPGNASAVYQWLCQNTSSRELESLGRMFHADDHSFWKKNAPVLKRRSFTEGDGGGGDPGEETQDYIDNGLASQRDQAMYRLWNEAMEMRSIAPHKPRRGTAPGSKRERMILHEKAQFDFRRYLRRYSVIQEELQLDPDSFDYIPYTLGLKLYGNMPLMEPLEYTEAFKVEQLVIAIDTSGSCDTATVQRFLAEVQAILTGHDNFFRKMEVHILQCDSYVHEHKVIHSVEEWTDYIRKIVIRGRGGTDFTPVFRYVEKLQQEGQAQRLKGLIYFTDGDGVYPKTETSYETAFAFSNWDFLNYRVPEWIVSLCLEEM